VQPGAALALCFSACNFESGKRCVREITKIAMIAKIAEIEDLFFNFGNYGNSGNLTLTSVR
jgi:hypothetical protein